MPEASRLVLLDQLSTVQPGSKVRFLGCVHAYDAERALLVLRTRYPATQADVSQANVAVDNILENLDHNLVSVGAWLNVVGYVHGASSDQALASARAARSLEASETVQVVATMIWSAGAIRTDRYDAAVRKYQKPLDE